MSDSSSLTSGVAGRYATALFEIAVDEKSLPAVEADLDKLSEVLTENSDVQDLISSPIYSRAESRDSILAIAKALGVGALVSNTLGVMADKRRLFALPAVIETVKSLAADSRGEITAEVTAAKKMTKAQQDKLAKALKASSGKDVKIDMSVDENLIGGLIVKIGSKMIDTSISSKLSNLQNVMKEVG